MCTIGIVRTCWTGYPTGDLRIVENVRWRKLLFKGPNFKEHRAINFNKCKIEIIRSIRQFYIKI